MCHASTLHPSHARPLAVQEFALLFAVFDETKSWYCAENLDRKCRPPRGTPAGDPAWREEYRFHAVNGYVADALLGLVMAEGRRTRWHLLSMGDPGHAQSVHFSAHSVTVRDGGEHRTAVCNLYPGVFTTVEMLPSRAGIWRVESLVGEHLQAGMSALFLVYSTPDPASMWFQAARSRLAWLPVTSGTRRSRLPATTGCGPRSSRGFTTRDP